FYNFSSFISLYFEELFYDRFFLVVSKDSYFTSFSVLCLFVGDDGVEYSLVESCFIYRKVRSHIFWKDEPFFSVWLLLPLFKLTKVISIVSTEFFTINVIKTSYSMAIGSLSIY